MALARRADFDPALLATIAVGGALGASARFGLASGWEQTTPAFPWATLTVNVVGCALIGVLMVLVEEEISRHRLVRPFLGIGCFGGFTTFSTYALDVEQLARADAVLEAGLYLAATVLGALLAVAAGIAATGALLRWRRRPR